MALSDLLKKKKQQVEDYFAPVADKVRVRDVVRELPGAVGDVFSGTRDTFVKGGRIIGEGAAYALDKNVRKQYLAGNTDVLPTITEMTPRKMLATTFKAGLEVAPVGKIKTTAKLLAAPSLAKRVAGGAGLGYGYDVADRLSKEDEVNKKTFRPGMGTVMGGIFSGIARPTAQITKQGIDDTVNFGKTAVRKAKEDINTFRNPAPTTKKVQYLKDGKWQTVSEVKDEIAKRLFSGSEAAFGDQAMELARVNTKSKPVRVVQTTHPKRYGFVDFVKDSIPQPGLSIKAVKGVPTNKNTRAINAINVKKNKEASLVVEQMKKEAPAKPASSVVSSTDPVEKFKQELDQIPAPFEKTRKVDTPLGTQSGPYNKWQQEAFDEKKKRIQAIREVVNIPDVLRAMGFRKKEAEKFGVEEGKIIAALGKLGYMKGDPLLKDVRSDTVRRILEYGIPHTTLREYYARKHELDTKFLEGVDPASLKDISPLQAGTRDVYRNFEDVFGQNSEKIKKELLDPFDAAKGEFIREQQGWLKALEDNVVNKLGIKKGSKESAAIQRYGDTSLPEGERLSYDDLVKQFGKEKADKIVEADGWFRKTYDGMIDELNRIREYYFPTHPLYPESTKIIPKRQNYYRHFREMADGVKGLLNIFDTPANIDPSLAVSSEFTKPNTKWLSFAQQRKGKQTDIDAVGGFLDYLKAFSYAKNIDPFISKFRGVDQELAAKARKTGEYFDKDRIGLAEELSRKLDPIEQIAEMTDQSKIKNLLIEKGLQDRDALRMAKELVDIKNPGAVSDYLKKNLTDEGFSEFKGKALAEDSENKLNSFLKFLDNFANDLAGKTNPMDRPIQDNFLGRQAFRAINRVNSRVKANVILGNVSSALAQFFGIPNGIANAGAMNSTKAVGDSLIGMFKKDAPIAKSDFITERYFNGYDKFEPGIVNDTKRFAIWLTSIGDKIGTTFTWNAQYRKALAEKIADPVKYADGWTRKMVAGRGIGEVPIMQKSKFMQVIAPFQLEVANQWRVFGDWAKNDPTKLEFAKKMMEFSIAVWVMNRVAKELRGSDVAFDPIQAMLDAYDTYQAEENKGRGALLAGGRIAGEVFSNLPGGSVPASWYPEYGSKDVFGTGVDLPTREKLFGDKDPTRFGGGLVVSKGLTDPMYLLMPPFGGRQIKNTIEGGKALFKGYAETASGKIMTPVEDTPYNKAKGFLFGKNALQEVQDYREDEGTPLGEKQDATFRSLAPEERKTYFEKVMRDREINRAKDALKKGEKVDLAGVSDEAGKYAVLYGYEDLLAPVPTGNGIMDVKKRAARESKIVKLVGDENVPENMQAEIIKRSGVSRNTAEWLLIKSLPTNKDEAPFIAKKLQEMSEDEFAEALKRKWITTGLTKEMAASGFISWDEKKALDAKINEKNGTKGKAKKAKKVPVSALEKYFMDAMTPKRQSGMKTYRIATTPKLSSVKATRYRSIKPKFKTNRVKISV